MELHDEDDASHVFELPIGEVRHLEDLSSDLGKVREREGEKGRERTKYSHDSDGNNGAAA